MLLERICSVSGRGKTDAMTHLLFSWLTADDDDEDIQLQVNNCFINRHRL